MKLTMTTPESSLPVPSSRPPRATEESAPRSRSRPRLAGGVASALRALLLGGMLASAPGWSARAEEPRTEPAEETELEAAREPTPTGAGAPMPTESRGVAATGGLRVFVDPVTGEILAEPTPEQVRALEALERERRLASPVIQEPRPVRLFAIPGGIGADLDERFLSSTVLRVRPDGSFETLCVDHPGTAHHTHGADGSGNASPSPKTGEEIR